MGRSNDDKGGNFFFPFIKILCPERNFYVISYKKIERVLVANKAVLNRWLRNQPSKFFASSKHTYCRYTHNGIL